MQRHNTTMIITPHMTVSNHASQRINNNSHSNYTSQQSSASIYNTSHDYTCNSQYIFKHRIETHIVLNLINSSLIRSFTTINCSFVIVNYYVTSKTINFHKFQSLSSLLIHHYGIVICIIFPKLQTTPHLDSQN